MLRTMLRRHWPGPECLDTTADTIDGLPGSNPSVSFAFFAFFVPWAFFTF